MNKTVVIAAVAVAVAIGIVVGIVGTTGALSPSTQSNDPNPDTKPDVQQNTKKALSGSVTIDGSSTVYPITEVIAEEFSKGYPEVTVTAAISGTGGGFERFVRGEIDINDASRPIKDGEMASAAENNIRWVEIPVAQEGLTIAVHPDNNMLPDDCISIEQLAEMWKPDRTIISWSDIDPSNPDKEIRLYGAGPDSGTFDYFTERVVGESRSSTTDYIPSEDDNILVYGIENDEYALGYIPLAYTAQAGDSLKILSLSDGGDCVYPTDEAIASGEYPLSRPLFIYVNYDMLKSKPELQAFVDYYLSNAEDAVQKVQYVTLPDAYYQDALVVLQEGKYVANDSETFSALYK